MPEPNTAFVAVAGGGYHSLGLRADGSIEAWGMYFVGQCDVPEPNSGFVAVGAGDYHSLGLRADGSIEAWGSNTDPYGDYSGQCDVPEPNSGFVAISAGGDHSLAVRADGSIEAWGSNEFGQSDVPAPNTGFVAVSAGYGHSLGLRADGSVVAWGANYAGECDVPVPNSGFVAVSAGTLLSLGLREDGSIAAWGDNQHGQCNVPEPNSGFVVVEAGDWHGLGIRADGSIAAWGLNSSGQCDAPTSTTGYGAVAGGDWHSLGIINADTDRDGLLDDWERNGVPYTGAGGAERRVMLPDANPYIKDLYVEVDAMSGLSLSNQSVARLETAFEFAPLSNPNNPDGSRNPDGVTLHILRDDSDLPHVAVWDTNENGWPLDFDNWRLNSYGTAAERGDPDHIALLEAKANAYRYCIVADRADNPATQSEVEEVGGCGQMPGDNFVVFLGSVGATDGGTADENRAAVFMHELGHNLGLDHGGGDEVNGKPNYPSIMNYVLSYKYKWNSGFWKMDYSREDAGNFVTLNEASLNENVGIGTGNGYYSRIRMPFGINKWVGGNIVRKVDYVTLDGSPTDFGDTAGTQFPDGNFDSGVAQDLNYAAEGPDVPPGIPSAPSFPETHHPFNDWAHVGLPLAATLGGGAPGFPTDELTADAIAWIDENFPPPPGSCRADLNGDGIVNTQDFLTYLNAWATGDPLADWNGDGTVNTQDFLAYLNDWSAGC